VSTGKAARPKCVPDTNFRFSNARFNFLAPVYTSSHKKSNLPEE
jgi:hypothetical protein